MMPLEPFTFLTFFSHKRDQGLTHYMPMAATVRPLRPGGSDLCVSASRLPEALLSGPENIRLSQDHQECIQAHGPL